MSNSFSLDFYYAYGAPTCDAEFRSCPEDFVVTETIAQNFSGEGDHLVVKIKKRNENTQWVADKLASYFGLKNVDVGFYGLKDRNAVTTQWFSLHLPNDKENPDWEDFKTQHSIDVEVLEVQRHNKKLRRGDHASNRFEIRLRNIQSIESLRPRLELISSAGVPNYFGEQRFGRACGNLDAAQAWIDSERSIKNKRKRGMIYSAARSYLFNLVLSERVSLDNWNASIAGDANLEVASASGPLWGRGRSVADGRAAEIEQEALQDWEAWCLALEHVGLTHERRAFALIPQDFAWAFEGDELLLSFQLAPGQFATSVLREICQLKTMARQ